ncbi:MAG TPA: glycosyltransferase family 4 protein [Candidatus Saccharimonadales bacterium]|nr:glycosyltransferase family 4 protein [Candidatus Saccharimonadales bacterium]
MKKLRVAMIAPPWLALPIKGYGGIELVIQGLVEELQKLGVEVELFANGARKMKGIKTHYIYKKELFDKIDFPYYDAPLQVMQAHLHFALKTIEASAFDVIHDHNPYIGPSFFALAGRIKGIPPILHTFHGPPFSTEGMLAAGQEDNRPQLVHMGEMGNMYMTAISKALADQAPKEIKTHMLREVHNAIEIDEFPFMKDKKDYYITLARFTADKGQHLAAKFAAKRRKRLRMAGTVAGMGSNRKLLFELSNPLSSYRRNEEFRYYSDKILPYVLRHRRITYSGNLSGPKKKKFIAEAKALLFPIQWEEPFGMAVIEALACGTPVVAMNRGAMPEIIDHGVTGFLANTEAEFMEYAERVGEIDPRACRKSVERRFTAAAMAKKYLKRYEQIIKLAKQH